MDYYTRTRFYISEDKDFIKKYIVKGNFPRPDGFTDDTLKEILKCGTLVKYNMYFYVNNTALVLDLGDTVVLGGLYWKIIDRLYNYDNNEITLTLKQE